MGFADDIAKFSVKVQGNSDAVVRRTVFRIMEKVAERSPVGNPRLWKVNVDRQARSTKRLKRKDLSAPAGYVGGHFRANWQLGIGALQGGEIEGHNHSAMLPREKAKMPDKPAGKVFYFGNNLPYAQEIENGHSQGQAPHGVIGLVTVEFGGIVDQAVAGVNR
jgi:hypothetical protein